MSEPETLQINVADEVKTAAIFGPPPVEINKEQLVEDGKKVMQDEIARYHEEQMKYIERYVKPHQVKSRLVTSEDIPHILKEADVMVNLCSAKHGMYGNANAIAHSQIEDREPLRFFVINNGMVIVNPVIISHTQHPVFKEEGCMSYPEEPMHNMVKRFNKITVRYQTLIKGESEEPLLSKTHEVNLKGMTAQVFQHECAHLNGFYIYDENADPLNAIGFGDGSDVSGFHLEDLITDEVYEAQGQSEAGEKDDDQGGVVDQGAETVRDESVAATPNDDSIQDREDSSGSSST